MNILRGNSRKNVKEMNWIDIDKILWEKISKWNGKEPSKKKILSEVSKFFNWSDKQTNLACARHFNMYNNKKIV